MMKKLAYRLLSLFLSLLLITTQVVADNWLINSYRFGAVAPTITFLQCASMTSGTSTFSFAAQNVGTASATRATIIGVAARDDSLTYTVSSITVGGDPANKVVDEGGTVSVSNAALGIVSNPVGTSETVVVTMSETMSNEVAICLWAAYDLPTLVPTSTGIGTSTSAASMSANLPLTAAKGIAVGMSSDQDSAGPTITWTGLTERSQIDAGNSAYSGADAITTGGALSITADWTGSTTTTVVTAGFGAATTIMYVGTTRQANPASATVTFSGVSTGIAADNRTTIVEACSTDNATSFTINSMTVDSNSATSRVSTTTTANRIECNIFTYPNPSSGGTSSTIVVVHSETLVGIAAIHVWAAYGLASEVPTATANNAGSSGANVVLNMNVVAGSLSIGACAAPNSSGGATWAGLTSRYDVATADGWTGAADRISSAASTPLTVGCDHPGTDDVSGAAATW